MMEGMADFSEILASCDDCNEEDREWLHHLVADWQVIADLSFADLLLLLRTGEGSSLWPSSAGPPRSCPCGPRMWWGALPGGST